MSKQIFQARQGDVLIEETNSMPGAKVKPEGGLNILARGEATGHHHSLTAKRATMFRDDSLAYSAILEVQPGTPLNHQEHTGHAVTVPKIGVIIQSTYEPAMLSRQVAD